MAAPRRATYHDLVAVPDILVAELIDGELFTSPRPASPHALAASAIGAELIGEFGRPPGDAGEPGGRWILFEPELHFGEDVLVPDQAGRRRESMPRVPNTPAFTLAPDWVLEVVSPSTGRLDRVRKMPVYAREGVQHLWLVDPLQHTLEMYGLHEGRWTVASTHGGDNPIRAEPFDAISLSPSRWWLDTTA